MTLLATGAALLLALGVWAFTRLRASRAESLAEARAEYEGWPTERLEALLAGLDYFRMDPAGDGRTMRAVPGLATYFEAIDARRWDWLGEHLTPFIAALAGAERELGYSGRPILMDYDTLIEAAVTVLAERTRPRG